MPAVFDLTGRRAVVTGAASGIGAATAQRFARAGATVIGIDVAPIPSDVAAACTSTHTLDVARESDVRAALASLVADGPVDVLVNNAGVSLSDAPVVDDTDASYLHAYRVNVLGAVHMIRAINDDLADRASIVNVSSLSAFVGSPGLGGYAASKAALVEITRTLALELAPRGIRVNAVAPSGVDTPMLAGDGDAVRRERAWVEHAPLPGLAHADEIAAAIHFLASPDVATLTGQCLIVDGGIAVGPSLSMLDLFDRHVGAEQRGPDA